MKNEIILSLFTDVLGVVGYLFREDGHLLSTAHPTTIAAAICAMGECEFVYLTDTKAVKVPFPISVANMGVLLALVDNRYEADFLIGLVKSSWFNFLNPHPADIQADSHLREAVSFLPKRLVLNGPSTSKQQGGTEELRTGERLSPFSQD